MRTAVFAFFKIYHGGVAEGLLSAFFFARTTLFRPDSMHTPLRRGGFRV